jgi:hypothetical protein
MMMTTDYQWDLILRAAEEMGVSRHARMKWKHRQMVPHKWRLEIIKRSRSVVTWDYFRKMDDQARRAA